jgi:acetylornithine deacetylase/succinyl-diaminopimelate desuccinylase-like protein
VVSPEPASLWNGDPFAPRVDGEWMYGRGAGDMKSGLAAMVGAVLWFQVRVLGRPAHAGDAADGDNAIDASYAAIEAPRALEAELNAVKPPLFAA